MALRSGRTRFLRILVLAVFCGLCSVASAQQSERTLSIRRLDGGASWINDFGRFSDTFSYRGRSGLLTIGAYLIEHNGEYMLWDTGLPATTKGQEFDKSRPSSNRMDKTVVEQLEQIGVKPQQIKYVAVSHFHTDHIGQADSFPQATLLIGEKDWQLLNQPGTRGRNLLAPWLVGESKVQPVDGDVDIFGDGTVVMFATPGHTAGHNSLLVNLKKMGPLILTGDLAHFQDNYQNDRVPNFNDSRADTLASLDRIKRMVKNLGGTVVIQHEKADVLKLPPFPEAAR